MSYTTLKLDDDAARLRSMVSEMKRKEEEDETIRGYLSEVHHYTDEAIESELSRLSGDSSTSSLSPLAKQIADSDDPAGRLKGMTPTDRGVFEDEFARAGIDVYAQKNEGDVLTDKGSRLQHKIDALASASEREGANGAIAAIKSSKDIERLITEGGVSTGPIEGNYQKTLARLSDKRPDELTDEEKAFIDFNAATTAFTANFIKAISGAQVSDKERQFLMNALPAPNKQEGENVQGMAQLVAFLKNNYEMKLGESLDSDEIFSSTDAPQPTIPQAETKSFDERRVMVNGEGMSITEALQWANNNTNDPIAQEIISDFGQEVTAQPRVEQKDTVSTPQKKDSLGGDLGERFTNMYNNIEEFSVYGKDRSFFDKVIGQGVELPVRQLGQVLGAVGDVGFRAIQSLYDVGVDDDVKQQIADTATEFLDTEVGKMAITALQSGAKEWEAFREEYPRAAKDLEGVGNVLAFAPIGKGGLLAGSEAKKLTQDSAELLSRTLGKDTVEKAGSDIFRAIKPTITVKRNKKGVQQAYNNANAELIRQGHAPKNLKEYGIAIADTKRKVWGDVEKKLAAGEALKVDLGDIADELKRSSRSTVINRVDSRAAEKLTRMADELVKNGKTVSVPDAEAIKQYLNAELHGTFGSFNLSNAEQNAKKMMTQRIGQQLDDVLSDIPGEFQGLKNKYGALREIEEDVLKREIVFGRQNPQGLVESFSRISGIGNVISGIASANPATIVKGGAELAIGQMAKKANDADRLIKKSFEAISKRASEFQPRSKTINQLRKYKGSAGLGLDDITKNPRVLKALKEIGPKENFQQFMRTVQGKFPELIDEFGEKNMLQLYNKGPEIMWDKSTSIGGKKLPSFNKAGTAKSAIEGDIAKAKASGKSFDEFVEKIDEGNPEFYGSVGVKTETGKPIIIKGFHGTDKQFDKFTIPKNGVRYTGNGVYFYPEAGSAGGYIGGAKNARVVESYLDLKNPYNLRLPLDNIDYQPSNLELRKIIDAGHDSIVVRTGPAGSSDDIINEIVVFNTENIKTKAQLKKLWNNQ